MGLRSWFTFPILLWLLGAALWASTARAAPPAGHTTATVTTVTTVTTVAVGVDHVILELAAPKPEVQVVSHAGRDYTQVTLPGAVAADQPGAPQLPQLGALAAVPPDARVTLAILANDTETIRLPAPLLPAPEPIVTADPQSPLPKVTGWRYRPDPAAYGAGLQPMAPVELLETAPWRHQYVARVRFHPMRYDATRNQIVVHRRLRVALHFDAPPTAADAVDAGTVDEGPFEAVFRTSLTNYAAGRGWRVRPQPSADNLAPSTAEAAARWWRVGVDRTGIVQITCAALAQAGMELAAVDLNTVRLHRDGRDGPQVAIRVRDHNNNRRCDAAEEDAILFYGEENHAAYSAENVYWITYGGAAGTRIQTTDAPATATTALSYTHTVTYTENRLYYSYIPLEPGANHWYWDALAEHAGASRVYTFTVDHLNRGYPAQITLHLAGYDGRHDTRVAVNDRDLAAVTWSGRTTYTLTVPVPADLLRAGDNTLRISAAGGAADSQVLDAFTMHYARGYHAMADSLRFGAPAAGAWRYIIEGFTTPNVEIYDITDPDQVRLVPVTAHTPCPCTVTATATAEQPRTYLAVAAARLLAPVRLEEAEDAGLRAGSNRADYLIVAPAALLPAMVPLAAQRAAQGLAVKTIDLQAIYDEFAGGRADPQALHDFLAYTVAHWSPPAPSYVLLVGDGTYDPRGYISAPPPHPLPAYLQLVDPVIGETASDNRLVAFAPGTNLPHMAVGRLPAASADEAAIMVEKILRYEQSTADAAWRGQATVVADNAYQANGSADAGGNFWRLADGVVESLAGSAVGQRYQVERLYFNPCDPARYPQCTLPDPSSPPYRTASDLTAALVGALRAGRAFVAYVGHAGPVNWGGVPPLLAEDDVGLLTTAAGVGVTLDLTCYTGYYHSPVWTALAEQLVGSPGGVLAAWASSGQGVARGHNVLAEGFFDAVFTQGITTLGLATVAAKEHLYTVGAGVYSEELDTFHLFGDPALPLLPPPARGTPAYTIYLPQIRTAQP